MKKIMTLFVIFFLVQSWNPVPITAISNSLKVEISFSPDKIVSSGSILTLHGNPNQYAILSVFLHQKDHLISLVESFELSPFQDNAVPIPITYPIRTDFTINVEVITPDFHDQFTESYTFQLQEKIQGRYRIRGRILQCSEITKRGLEGAVIETLSGPSYARIETEDDGYFSLESLQKGQYKLRISHPCTANSIEKIVWVDNETPFLDGCLAVYGIPDVDIWMNKPSGSSFEKEETATVNVRSSLPCVADIYISDLHRQKLIISQFQIPEEQLVQYFWKIPSDLPLGKYTLFLEPKETKLCGKAQYLFEIKSSIRTGTIQGKVVVDGKPVEGAEVTLPLQFMGSVMTDSFGQFEIPDVKPGIHTLRVRKDGFTQTDQYGVEVKNSQTTKLAAISLQAEETIIHVYPEKIFLATHERKAMDYPVSLYLEKGYCQNLTLELINAPVGVSLSTSSIPSLLQEKRVLSLQVSESIEPGEYPFSLHVFNETVSSTVEANLVVSGLSVGTFTVRATPYKQSVSMGEEAVFRLELSKYTNFQKQVTFTPLNLPDYWECRFDPVLALPPSVVTCTISPSLSVKPGSYTILIQAKADKHINMISLPIEVLPQGGDLLIYPFIGWQPILESDSHGTFPLVFSSSKGVTENVRINIDYGPSWMKLSQREIGSLDHQAKTSSLLFTPDAEVGSGGYDYAISFTFGQRNEGYKKLAGRIHILKNDPSSPTNLRAKLIEEEGTIQLTWGPPAKNALEVIGYNVYKSLHYPNVESTIPTNSSLIKERTFSDKEFVSGKTYWYIVKAVYSNGTISQPSNTAEMPVYPFESVIASLSLSKGENSTYFIGKPLPFSFFSTVSGEVSFSLLSPHFRILLFRFPIEAMQMSYFQPILPWIEENVQLEAIFISEKGTRQVLLSAFTVRESASGSESITGILQNSLFDLPVSNALVEVWEGPSEAAAYSDHTGKFALKGLSKGNYRFLVSSEHHKMVTQPITLPMSPGTDLVWDCAWESDSTFLFWHQTTTDPISLDTPVSLFFKSQEEMDVTITVRCEGKTKTLINQLHLTKDRTQLERVMLPEDLPNGTIQIETKNIISQTASSIFLKIQRQDPPGSLFHAVRDTYGNPLPECSVNETTTNEWGYFFLPVRPTQLTVHKYGYETVTLPLTSEEAPEIRLPYLQTACSPNESEVFISKDFTELILHFQEQEGASRPFSLGLFTSKTNDKAEEIPVFSIESVVLFPGYLYQYLFSDLAFTDISASSRIEIRYDDGTNISLPIKQGNEALLFIETDPAFLSVTPGALCQFKMDIYSQGSFPKPYQLTIENTDPDLEIKLSSLTVHSGSIINGSLLLLRPKPNRFFQIRFGIWMDSRRIGQVMLGFEQSPVQTPALVEKQWSTMLYQGMQSVFHLSFTHAGKPAKVELPSTIPVSFEISEGMLQFKAAPVETGLWRDTALITLQSGTQFSFPIEIECIPKDPWLIPSLNAENLSQGMMLSVQNLVESASYQINRIKQIPGNAFITTGWIRSKTYTDSSVRNQTAYTYRIFATNGRLESDWSNAVTKYRNPLSLSLSLTDNLTINQKSVEVTGTTNGSFLFINERSIRLDLRGGFKETILLTEGVNSLVFLVKDDFGNQLRETRSITVDTKPPEISLLQPAQRTVETTLSQIAIQIRTNEACILIMNQQTIQPDYQTDWSINQPIQSGKQVFQLVAIDRANNQSKLDLIVTRYKTILTIELAIDRALAIVNQEPKVLDAPPVILQGRTMVPLRFIAEAFGAKVDWVAATKEITLWLDTIQLRLKIGQKTAYKNNETMTLDAPPVILQGRTMVPLRFIAEAFGAKVDWVAATKEIKILLKR